MTPDYKQMAILIRRGHLDPKLVDVPELLDALAQQQAILDELGKPGVHIDTCETNFYPFEEADCDCACGRARELARGGGNVK